LVEPFGEVEGGVWILGIGCVSRCSVIHFWVYVRDRPLDRLGIGAGEVYLYYIQSH
jgi:hypothetical protein